MASRIIPPNTRRPRGALAPVLRVVDSPDARLVDRGLEVEGALVIGREPGPTGLAIDDKKCSARHCTIELAADGGLVFRDEKSKNGSYLGGVKVPHGALGDGDVLRLGQTVLVATRRGADGPLEDPEHDLVGTSPAFRAMCVAAVAAADDPRPLALTGEPGVEVEALARLVHRRGRGSDGGPFVALDCAALEGAAADAATRALRDANGGTLFLDEVGALAPEAQATLLAAMSPAPRGTTASRRAVDVRVVSAVYPEVAPAITAGRFRGDVYERLAATTLAVPPLRDRREDILRLIRHHARVAVGTPLFQVEALEQLLVYAWPENRREVRQLVMRIATKRRPIAQADLPKTVLPGDKPLAPPEPIVNNEALRGPRRR